MGNHAVDSQDALVENRLVQMSDPALVVFGDGAATVATATRQLICWVPAGSLITNVLVLITELFDSDGNDYLTVGSYADDDLLLNDLTLAAANTPLPYNASKTAALTPYYVAADTSIYATYVYSGTAPTTGALQVAIEWVPWHIRDVDITKVG